MLNKEASLSVSQETPLVCTIRKSVKREAERIGSFRFAIHALSRFPVRFGAWGVTLA